jgi:type I restriction enzyme S subunit
MGVTTPQGWKEHKLGSLGIFSKGQGIRKKEVKDSGLPCVRYGEIYTYYGTVVRDIKSFIDLETSKQSKKLNNGDILFAGSGETKEEIGKATVFLGTQETYAGGDIVIFSPQEVHPVFLGYLVNSPQIVKQKMRMGKGDAVVHISSRDLSDINLCIPENLFEQKVIAEALSDIDDLILLIKKEIDKKQNIKLAISENLFSNVYSEIIHLRLRDIGFFYGGLSGKSGQDFRKGNSKYITFLNVINNVIADPNMVETVDIKSSEKQNVVLEGDLLFNGSSETPEEVAFPSLVPSTLDGFYLNSFCFGFRFEKTDSLDPLFFAHYLRSRFGRQFVSQLAQGSTRYNISKNALYDLVWNLPTLRTQIEIGKILSDLDSDLSELKKKKSKYEWIKQGMMNDLLTGKVRLV